MLNIRTATCNIFSIILTLALLTAAGGWAAVRVGAERLFEEPYVSWIKGRKIGLICNHTALSSGRVPTYELLRRHAAQHQYAVCALFAPEHGLTGSLHASDKVGDAVDEHKVPVYGLHGERFRPSAEQLSAIDLLIYDIQDVGIRSYTYTTTLYYVMEEAAKHNIALIVLDRPNPMGGLTVDGFVLEEQWHSTLGKAPLPLCHGMTVGEIARFYKGACGLACPLQVVPMEGWRRAMSYAETGLPWLPPSPQIPEPTTPFYYAITGAIGELQIVKIGVGNSFPFRVVGAPWIDAEAYATALNKQAFPGVAFLPFHFRPHYGKHANEECHGVFIEVTDATALQPIATQYLLLGTLKALYPDKLAQLLRETEGRQLMFNRVQGSRAPLDALLQEKYMIWPLRQQMAAQRAQFMAKRQPYLLY